MKISAVSLSYFYRVLVNLRNVKLGNIIKDSLFSSEKVVSVRFGFQGLKTDFFLYIFMRTLLYSFIRFS